MLFEEGLEGAFERHRLLAEAVRRAVEDWSKGQALGFSIENPAERANSVTTVLMHDDRDPTPLLDFCEKKCGVVVGVGIGALTGKAIRIAHMGHVNAPMVLGTLGVVETGLVASDSHGKGGVQAAVSYLGENVSARTVPPP